MFLSPGHPRLPVLGQGDLLQETGSPGGRPPNSISHLLQTLQNSITTQGCGLVSWSDVPNMGQMD